MSRPNSFQIGLGIPNMPNYDLVEGVYSNVKKKNDKKCFKKSIVLIISSDCNNFLSKFSESGHCSRGHSLQLYTKNKTLRGRFKTKTSKVIKFYSRYTQSKSKKSKLIRKMTQNVIIHSILIKLFYYQILFFIQWMQGCTNPILFSMRTLQFRR